MRRALSVALIATLGLFGCAVPEEAADSERWSKVLTDAVAPIQHVEKTVDLGYSLQGPFGADSAWLNGTLWTDTDDPEINRAVLDEAGRAIAESFAQNPAKKSWVKVAVASKSTVMGWTVAGVSTFGGGGVPLSSGIWALGPAASLPSTSALRM